MPPTENRTNSEISAAGDGSLKPNVTIPTSSPTTVQHKEPEDAYLTGGQRNLQRRVLGLNVEENQAHRPPDPSPGLHSTGSFTGVANGETGRDTTGELKEKT